MARKSLETANVGAGNWKGVGMWAWLLHRISGLVILGYLFAHIWTISHAQQGAARFDRLFRTLESPLFVVLDLLLLGAVLYHAFNGIRVLLFDLGVGIRRHKALFAGLILAGLAVVGWFAYVSFSFILA